MTFDNQVYNMDVGVSNTANHARGSKHLVAHGL